MSAFSAVCHKTACLPVCLAACPYLFPHPPSPILAFGPLCMLIGARLYCCRKPLTKNRFVAGAMAGAMAQLVIYPLEIAKTRLAVGRKNEFKGIGDCIHRIVRYVARCGHTAAFFLDFHALVSFLFPTFVFRFYQR